MEIDSSRYGIPILARRAKNMEEENEKNNYPADVLLKKKSSHLGGGGMENSERDENSKLEEDDSNSEGQKEEGDENYIKYQSMGGEGDDDEDSDSFQQKLDQFLNDGILKNVIQYTSASLRGASACDILCAICSMKWNMVFAPFSIWNFCSIFI